MLSGNNKLGYVYHNSSKFADLCFIVRSRSGPYIHCGHRQRIVCNLLLPEVRGRPRDYTDEVLSPVLSRSDSCDSTMRNLLYFDLKWYRSHGFNRNQRGQDSRNQLGIRQIPVIPFVYRTIVEHFVKKINTFSVGQRLTILGKMRRIDLLSLKRRNGLYEISM